MKSSTRKIIRVGKKSYAVVIPKKWLHFLGVYPGSPVYVVMNDDGTITVAPLKTSASTPAKLGAHATLSTLTADDRSITKVVLALYSAGLSSLTIDGSASWDLASLPRELARVERVDGRALISFRELKADPREVLENMVRKVREAFRLLSENLEKLSPELWNEIHRIESELDVMAHLVLRLAIRKLIVETLKKGLESETLVQSVLDVSVAKLLEDLSDCIDRSAHRIEEYSTISRDYKSLLTKVSDLSSDVMMCYLHRCSVDDVLLNLSKASKLREELKELMSVSASPLQTLLSEIEVAITLVEDLLEATLVLAYG
ncbi:MAG: AbrB/MazE/SpoVT family DNA-binding domain-containing protein [Sulfolobales archaeon]